MAAIYDHSHCTGEICLASDFTTEETLSIEKVIEKGLKKIYTGTYKGEFPEEFWAITAEKLNQAVDAEFGSDYKPLSSQLKYQNGVFAAFKAKNQTQTLENLLKASKAATFTDYAQEVRSTVQDYSINYLRAEWNTAKMACRSAKNWAKAVEDSDIFPNIEYTASTARDPRDSHKPYYGMIRPMNDPIWNTILPPSVWGCQCGWKTSDKDITKAPAGVPPAEPGLDNNPGQDGALFSPSHPYVKTGKSEAQAILKSNIADIHGIDESEISFFEFDKKTNGCIFSVGDKITKEGEFKINRMTATVLMERGNMVELLKRVETEGVKSIDALVNGFETEFKVCSSKTSIDNGLRNAAGKAKNLNTDCDVVLHISGKMETGTIENVISDRMRRVKKVRSVYVIKGKEFYRWDKNTKGMQSIP